MSALLRVTVFCFAASYAFALALELWHVYRPRPILRYASLGFGAAGLLAHGLFVVFQPLPLASAFGSLIFLALILAVFYFYGALHHRNLAWGVFVLPLVLGLVILANVVQPAPGDDATPSVFGFRGEHFWGMVHGILVLLAAVGICVGFLASLMYFVQLHRLRAKVAPTQGVRLWNLERIEAMNRRAILCAFPLLTAGLVVGIALQLHRGELWIGLSNPKVLSSLGLWVVFAILLYLRYAIHARGRQLAFWTIIAFALLVISLLFAHPFADGAINGGAT